MKRIILLFALLLFSFSLFAISNRVYFDTSREYIIISEMSQLEGVNGPSPLTPVSEAELYKAFRNINRERLPESYKSTYDELDDLFNQTLEKFNYDFSISITPQVMLATNKNSKAEEGGGRNNFFVPYKNEKPFLGVELALDFGSFATIQVEAGIKNSAHNDDIPLLNTSFLLYSRDDNWYLLSKDGVVLYDTNVPNIAITSLGNKWFKFNIGRAKINLGRGIYSNMVLSDNFPYHEFAQLSFLSDDLFTYNIFLISFDNRNGEYSFDRPTFKGMHRRSIFHIMEFDLNKKSKIIFTLGTMLYGDNSFDFKWITPFYVLHNMFNYDEAIVDPPSYDEANNIMGFEINWAIAPKINLDAQLVVDQFQLFFESQSIIPNALGGLVNISYVDGYKDGIFKVWAEGVYTNPYLYLNEKIINGVRNYNYDWIVGYFSSLDKNAAPNISYIGYQYGPDTIALSIGANVKNPKKETRLAFMYKMHGEKGLGNSTISGFNPKKAFSLSGVLEHQLMLTYTGYYNITTIHQIIYGLNLSWYNNYLNQLGVKKFISQFMFGLKINIL